MHIIIDNPELVDWDYSFDAQCSVPTIKIELLRSDFVAFANFIAYKGDKIPEGQIYVLKDRYTGKTGLRTVQKRLVELKVENQDLTKDVALYEEKYHKYSDVIYDTVNKLESLIDKWRRFDYLSDEDASSFTEADHWADAIDDVLNNIEKGTK